MTDHWLFIWPAYGATVGAFMLLAVYSISRLQRWSRAADEDQT